MALVSGVVTRRAARTRGYGWSQDAVDTLLATLFHVGQLRIVNVSGAPWQPGKVIVRDVTSSTFSRETA